MSRSPHLLLAKKYWQEHLRADDLAVDATCGNGHDTLFLSTLLPLGEVFAFDIQREAIQSTKKLLETDPDKAQRVRLHLSSHGDWSEKTFPKPPRLIVYNLGYLPQGDKRITTQTETTLESIRLGLQLLASDGAMSITCYPGHEEGEREEVAIAEFLAEMPSDAGVICHHRFINRKKAPSLFWINRR